MSRAYDEEQGRESNKERVNHRVRVGWGSSVSGWETELQTSNRTVMECYIGLRLLN